MASCSGSMERALRSQLSLSLKQRHNLLAFLILHRGVVSTDFVLAGLLLLLLLLLFFLLLPMFSLSVLQLLVGLCGIESLCPALGFVQVLFVQKGRLEDRASQTELKFALHQIDRAVETLEHVQSQQQVHVFWLGRGRFVAFIFGVVAAAAAGPRQGRVVHNGDAAGKVVVPDLELDNVDPPQYLSCPDPDGHSVEARVQQVQDPAPLGAGLAHDGHLGPTVDKGLEGVGIDLGVDVEHQDPAHALGVFLHGLHVLLIDQTLGVLLGKIFLGLGVVGILLEALLKVSLLVEGLGRCRRRSDGISDPFLPPDLDGLFEAWRLLDLSCQVWLCDDMGVVRGGCIHSCIVRV
jgi:hypothetical protein